LLSEFEEQPAVLIKFTFEFPPVIGEVNIFGAPASWLIVSVTNYRKMWWSGKQSVHYYIQTLFKGKTDV